jgi:hypothetical protein
VCAEPVRQFRRDGPYAENKVESTEYGKLGESKMDIMVILLLIAAAVYVFADGGIQERTA